MNYATGHAFTGKDLFAFFPVNKLKMSKKKCIEVYSDGNKRDLCEQIFLRSLRIILDDIIENNIQFKLPGMGTTNSYLQMKRTHGEEFKNAFRNGKWRDVDFIASDFSGYQMTFDMEGKNKTKRQKLVYLGGKDKQRITNHTNEGKQY